MREVFVDTGAFYAALNRKDAHHQEAVQLFTRAVEEEWQVFTSNFVVAETHALILTRLGREDRPRHRTQTLFPYLFIRAVPGDRGKRPLWEPTPFWESCDIHLLPVEAAKFDFSKTVLQQRCKKVGYQTWLGDDLLHQPRGTTFDFIPIIM